MRTLLEIAVLAVCAHGTRAQTCGDDFLVTAFGAAGDGVSIDTPAIAAAIIAASKCPNGGRVVLPMLPPLSPSAYISGSIFLESNVDLHIAAGATLRATTNFSAFPVVIKPSGFGSGPAGLVNGGRCLTRNASTCLKWHKLGNVTISGGGTIDGAGPAWWWASTWWPTVPRPFLLELQYVDGLLITGVSLVRSALWTIVPSLSKNVLIEYIHLDAGVDVAPLPYNGYNIDGLDSNNVINMTLRHAVMRAGDDCVAINSRSTDVAAGDFPTRNVTIGPNVTCFTPITIGSGTGIGVYDVTVRDSLVDGRWGNKTREWLPKWYQTALRFKTARGRGPAGVDGVKISNVTGLGVDLMVDFQSYYSCQNSSGTANYLLCRDAQNPPLPRGEAPAFQNVHISGLRGDAWRPVWLNCLPEHPCTNITFSDVRIDAIAPQWVCDNVQGGAVDVSPPADGCFS